MASVMSAPRSRRFALFYANYRRFWVAEVIHTFALYLQSLGVGALVLGELGRLGEGLLWVGLASAIPAIALSIPGGLLADRHEPYRLLMGSRVLMLLGQGVLALLALAGMVELWMAIVWSAANGVLLAVAVPAAHTMLPRLIDHAAMPSAVALISGISSAMSMVTPIAVWASLSSIDPELALWVVIFALEGSYAEWVLLVAAAFSAVSLLVLLSVHSPARDPGERGGGEGVGVMAGIRFVFGRPVLLGAIGLSFAASLFEGRYFGLLYPWVADLPSFGSWVLLLGALAGVGGIAAALWVVRRGIGGRPGVLMLASAAAFGLLAAASAATIHLAPVIVLPLLLLVSGFAPQLSLIIGLTVVQLVVADRLRGRVMGIWAMTTFLAFVGGNISLSAAQFIGPRFTMAAGALALAAFAIVIYAASTELRRLRGDDVLPPTEPAASPPAGAS